jgi:hypothetical protein
MFVSLITQYSPIRPRERVVPRARLIERLNESLRCSMKLIDVFQ